jgi:hypothetical protein
VFVGVCVIVGLIVAVPVAAAVGVIVIKRNPLDATVVAKTESVFDPYGISKAVFVGVAVCVSVAVGVAVALAVTVFVGVVV